MLVTNQRLDQLAAAKTDFVNRHMLTIGLETRRVLTFVLDEYC